MLELGEVRIGQGEYAGRVCWSLEVAVGKVPMAMARGGGQHFTSQLCGMGSTSDFIADPIRPTAKEDLHAQRREGAGAGVGDNDDEPQEVWAPELCEPQQVQVQVQVLLGARE